MESNKPIRPNDIVTAYNDKIVKLIELFERIDADQYITDDVKVYLLLDLVSLYRKENELLGLSLKDKDGKQYMNFLCSFPEETYKYNTDDHILQLSEFFLHDLIKHYFILNKDMNDDSSIDGVNTTHYLPEREKRLLDAVFTSDTSVRILSTRHFGYAINPEGKYPTDVEMNYCIVVLDLVKEILIRSYNYSKYIAGPDYQGSVYNDVIALYSRLASNADRDLEYINKSPVGKLLYKVRDRIELSRES